MEGFFEMQVPAWVVRVVTRAIAIVPAFIVVYTYGADSAADLIEQAQVEPACVLLVVDPTQPTPTLTLARATATLTEEQRDQAQPPRRRAL
jgi:Mn2+/Fe2+ NRAMP family transporter